MTIDHDLDTRFREAAAASGELDVAYDVADSPIGPLLVAANERGLCRIGFDGDPERDVESLARAYGVRVLRVPRRLDPVRRQLDEYFAGEREVFDLPLDITGVPQFNRRALEELARVPFGQVTTYGRLAERIGQPRSARAIGGAMNRNPIPIVLPCHRVVGSTGSLTGYGGGLHRKRALLELEGVSLPV